MNSCINAPGPAGVFAASCAALNAMETREEVNRSRGERAPPKESRASAAFLGVSYAE